MSTKKRVLIGGIVVLVLALCVFFAPKAKAASGIDTSTPSVTSSASVDTTTVASTYLPSLNADTSSTISKAIATEKSAAKSQDKYESTINKLGPFFKKVLLPKATVISNISKSAKSHIKKHVYKAPLSPMSASMITTDTSIVLAAQSANVSAHNRYFAALANLDKWKHSKKAIDKAFSNQGHAHLTSYNDGTRSYGDAAGDPSRRGGFFLLPGIGFFQYTDVGGAVHGTARADIYTPWASEPCNDALGIFNAGGPNLYDFHPKALGISISGSSFRSQKRHYEQPSSVRSNHAKYGVYSK